MASVLTGTGAAPRLEMMANEKGGFGQARVKHVEFTELQLNYFFSAHTFDVSPTCTATTTKLRSAWGYGDTHRSSAPLLLQTSLSHGAPCGN